MSKRKETWDRKFVAIGDSSYKLLWLGMEWSMWSKSGLSFLIKIKCSKNIKNVRQKKGKD